MEASVINNKGEAAKPWWLKLRSREEKLSYLETANRYWYSNDWYGSEKRKGPA